MDPSDKVYVAGDTGMVGSAIKRLLEEQGYTNIITCPSSNLDLRVQDKVDFFFKSERPDYVFVAAAKVGGLLANNRYRAEFLFDNLIISTNIIHASFKYGVKKLLSPGYSCIYPKISSQPIKEEYLLTGPTGIYKRTLCDCKDCPHKIV
jgi:GDP-L-fucose synthase